MEMKLIRKGGSATSTEGDLFIDGVYECCVLEDLVRSGPKVYGKTAIPEGRYRVKVTLSTRWKRYMPQVMDVPGFEGIRIHCGNSSKDTEGCLLVGRKQTTLGDDWIAESRLAYDKLFPKIEKACKAGEVWLTITSVPLSPCVQEKAA